MNYVNKIKFKPNKKFDNSNNTIKTYNNFGQSIENNIRLQSDYSTLPAYKFSLKRKSFKKKELYLFPQEKQNYLMRTKKNNF